MLVNVCLQSCTGLNNSTIPTKQKSTQPTQAVSSVAYNQNLNLIGASNKDKDKGKEKVTQDGTQWEQPSNTAQVTTNTLEGGQIASAKNHGSTDKPTLLHQAAFNGDLIKVTSLLLMDSHINARDQFGCTPLHLAAQKGHTEIVKLLLEQGSNPYAAEYNGLSALHLASFHNHVQAVNLLLQRTDVNIKDRDGYSPLFLATRSQNILIVEALIGRGANVNAQNKLGNTPLHEAVRRANLDIVSLLCNRGADVNAQNVYGWTPLHLAAQRREEIVKCLVANGADINTKNNDGLTPIDLAKQERADYKNRVTSKN
jgi:ankyrin repeat protein